MRPSKSGPWLQAPIISFRSWGEHAQGLCQAVSFLDFSWDDWHDSMESSIYLYILYINCTPIKLERIPMKSLNPKNSSPSTFCRNGSDPLLRGIVSTAPRERPWRVRLCVPGVEMLCFSARIPLSLQVFTTIPTISNKNYIYHIFLYSTSLQPIIYFINYKLQPL